MGGEARQRDREGQEGQVERLLRYEGQAHEEQEWEGRVQEGVRARQEELGVEWCEGLVGGREEGAEGARLDRFRRDRWQICCGQGSLCEGEVLAVSSPSSSSTRFCRSEARLIRVRKRHDRVLLTWFSRGM